MNSLRILVVASFVALAPTAAATMFIADVSLSPDPPLALEPFALQVDFSYSSSCDILSGGGTPTTAPGSVTVDYFFSSSGDLCQILDPPAPYQDEVPIDPLPVGDYTFTVNLSGGLKPVVQVYTGQFTVVPEPSVALLVASGLLGLAIAGKAGR
jgi:hypothetical protein